MSLGSVMTELLALADGGPPAATAIEQAFAARSTRQDRDVGRKGDVHLTMQGDIAFLKIWEDSRGWGAYTDVSVTNGSLTDLEAVVGPTRPMPRTPADFTSGDERAAYVTRAGKTIRVFAELDKADPTKVRKVTVHFQR